MKCTIIIVNYINISVKSDGDFLKISILYFNEKVFSFRKTQSYGFLIFYSTINEINNYINVPVYTILN